MHPTASVHNSDTYGSVGSVVQRLEPGYLYRTGAYFGSILAGVDTPLSDTRRIIKSSRVIHNNLIQIQGNKKYLDHAYQFMYYTGFKLILDKSAMPHVTCIPNYSGSNVILALNTSNKYQSFPKGYAVHTRNCLNAGYLLPFHSYGHSSMTMRMVIGSYKMCVMAWMPPVDVHMERLNARTGNSQPKDFTSRHLMEDSMRQPFEDGHLFMWNTNTLPTDAHAYPGGVNLVLAPSGAGKSHFVKQWSLKRGLAGASLQDMMKMELPDVVFIDGDKLVDWPTTPLWWKTMSDGQQVNMMFSHISRIYELVCKFPSKSKIVVLFNTHHAIFKCVKRGIFEAQMYAPITGMKSDHSDQGRITTFGSGVCLYAATSSFADMCGATQLEWKSTTRYIPTLTLLSMLGTTSKVLNVLSSNGYIREVLLSGVPLQPSGHVLNALLSIAFPNIGSMCQPDVHQTLTRFRRNYTRSTYSLEPTFDGTSYHSWLEVVAGVLGSVTAIGLILKRSNAILHYKNYVLWILTVRRMLKDITINDRTSITTDRLPLRDKDPRFGMLD